jgi:exonuclease SbcC
MYELANKEVNTLKAQLKNFPLRDWEPTIDRCKLELEIAEKSIDELTKKSQDKQSKLSQLQLELSKHKDTTPVTKSQVESSARRVVLLEQQAKSCTDSIQRLEDEIQDYNLKLETIKNVKAENNITVLRARYSAYKTLESSLSTLQHLYEKESTQLKQYQKSLKILDEVPCGDDYPSCKFIKDAHVNKEKITVQTEKFEQALSKLNEAQAALDVINKENVVERVEKMEKLLVLESKLQLDVSRKETELARTKSSCDVQRVDMLSAKERLQLLEEALKNEENAEAVSIKSNIEAVLESIRDIDTLKFETATKKGKLTAELEKLNEEKAVRDDLLEKMKVHDLVVSAFSKRGIPTIITKSQLPAINAEVAKILHGIVDFSIELENDEESDSSEIYINYGDSRRVIELCSGMEKTIASLAIRVAMINVSSLPRPDIFIIDEGFGTLDDASVEACNRLLTSLKRYFRVIIVITHVDGIKDVVDHVLEITKNEKDARISYGEES